MCADTPGADTMAGDSRYREIFEAVPVALWHEDFSTVATFLDRLRAEGVSDLRSYLEDHPEQLQEAIRRVKVVDVNLFTCKLFEVERKQDLLQSLADTFLPGTASIFVDELLTLWDGHRRFAGEMILRTMRGREIE